MVTVFWGVFCFWLARAATRRVRLLASRDTPVAPSPTGWAPEWETLLGTWPCECCGLAAAGVVEGHHHDNRAHHGYITTTDMETGGKHVGVNGILSNEWDW